MAPVETVETGQDTKPLWTPNPEKLKNAHLTKFAALVEKRTGARFKNYHEFWEWSNQNMNDFWSVFWDFAEIKGVKGNKCFQPAKHMMDAKFFPEARLNYAENLLRRRDTGKAIVFRDERGLDADRMTYQQLAQNVGAFAKTLRKLRVQKGDVVGAILPNMPESIIGALACASIGAIWASASPDFGVEGIIDRFEQVNPKVLIGVNGYFYGGKTHRTTSKCKEVRQKLSDDKDKEIKLYLVQYVPERVDTSDDFVYLWDEAIKDKCDPTFEPVEFDHPLYILFSSGTTGAPKCMIHGHGGTLLQITKEHLLQNDVHKNDRVFQFTTTGWMMWHWLVGALICEATIMLFDGSPFYPSGYALWEYAEKERFTLFGTSAKYLDALKSFGVKPADQHNLSSLKTLTSTGSPLMHESFDYVYEEIHPGVHLASIYGGSDIICASFGIGNPWSPVYRGELQGSGLATNVDIYDKNGQSAPIGVPGDIVCKNPIPSMPVGFWNDPEGSKYKEAYFERFPGVWHHGDWAEKTSHKGLIIHGRSDATLNPGGVRIGTAEIYRQVEKVEGVLESMAVGQDWEDDCRIILFVVLKKNVKLDDVFITTIKRQLKENASPRHVPAIIIQVPEIPRTKSGKIVELAVRDLIHGRDIQNMNSLANPECLKYYKDLDQLKS